MTCVMDTDLMTLFLLRHRNVLSDKAIRRHPPPLGDILKHVKDGEHALTRKLWIDMNTDSVHLFRKSKKGDNPFNCFGSLAVATYNCRLKRVDQKEVTYEGSKCNAPKHVKKKWNEHKVGTPTFSNILHPQEKILKEKGYDGKITIPCPVSTSLQIDTANRKLL